MSYILSIGTAVPRYRISQMEIHSFMNDVYTGSDEERRRLKLLYERSGIKSRHSSVPDYSPERGQRDFFPHTKNLEPFPSLEQRMIRFHEEAPGLAIAAIENCLNGSETTLQQITHLITVSCTGLAAPGLDIMLIEQLRLPKNTHRTSVNFMGCYAAVHALKMADAICNNDANARVMIICVELCTLHFQKKQDYDNLTANAIFADGASAALVSGNTAANKHTGNKFSITGFYAEVHSDGKNDMAWQLSSTGFLMTLSSYIPQLIESGIDALLLNALQQFGIKKTDIERWAIHPGGRKILEVIEKKLDLEPHALVHSYDVLSEHGNMSSATILFVLKRMLDENRKNENIFGAAFGPGLTMETFLLKQL